MPATITVTQAHIDRCNMLSDDKCMVALALKDYTWSVWKVSIFHATCGPRKITLPLWVAGKISEAHSRASKGLALETQPFTFEIDL